MLMNKTEFWLMNNPVRRVSMRFEAKRLRKMSPAESTLRADIYTSKMGLLRHLPKRVLVGF